MRFTSTSGLLALTVAIAMGLAGAALAQDAPADAKSAPDAQPAPDVQDAPADAPKVEPPPMPDKGTTSQLNCIEQSSEYKQSGKSLFYVQTFANKCDVRMKCTIYAYQLNARGPSQGHGTLTLAAKAEGAAAKKSYALKIKGAGGFSTSERECRVI